MARIQHVKKAQQRYEQVPVLDENGDPVVTHVLRADGTQKVTKKGREVTRRQVVDDKSKPLPPYNCNKCGEPIEIGTPYKWVKVKSGPYGGVTYRRHEGCPTWRPSELSTSKMAGIYAAQEHFDDEVSQATSVDDLRSLANDIAEMVREVAGEYRESGEAVEEGFGHPTYVSEELVTKADDLDTWADDIEGVDLEEPPECLHDDLEEGEPEGDCEDCDDGDLHESSAAWIEWFEEQVEALTSVVNECPV